MQYWQDHWGRKLEEDGFEFHTISPPHPRWYHRWQKVHSTHVSTSLVSSRHGFKHLAQILSLLSIVEGSSWYTDRTFKITTKPDRWLLFEKSDLRCDVDMTDSTLCVAFVVVIIPLLLPVGVPKVTCYVFVFMYDREAYMFVYNTHTHLWSIFICFGGSYRIFILWNAGIYKPWYSNTAWTHSLSCWVCQLWVYHLKTPPIHKKLIIHMYIIHAAEILWYSWYITIY
jgi:hypothetical protein